MEEILELSRGEQSDFIDMGEPGNIRYHEDWKFSIFQPNFNNQLKYLGTDTMVKLSH